MAAPSPPRPRFGEGWLVAVLDSLSEGVIALDDSGTIIAANPAAERLLGFRIAEQRYRPWQRLSWRTLTDEGARQLTHAEHPVASTLRDRQDRPPQVVGLATATGVRWLALATHWLADAGGLAPEGVVVSFQDVTDRVQAEHERQELIGVLRDLMAGTSHDLRNPLTVISGTTELLLSQWDRLDDADRVEAVTVVARQAAHLHRLVDDLSLLSRLEGGALVAEPQAVVVADLVDSALDGLKGSPNIEVEVDPRLRVTVDADHGRRMLLNLVDNACKYGAPPIRVAAVPDEDGGVLISVHDHGTGVPPELVGRLFDRFTRGRSGGGVAGMGLGLAIVDRLATLAGGSVRHRDLPDGTRFELRLPTPAAVPVGGERP